jgi:hypothetical protein
MIKRLRLWITTNGLNKKKEGAKAMSTKNYTVISDGLIFRDKTPVHRRINFLKAELENNYEQIKAKRLLGKYRKDIRLLTRTLVSKPFC